MSRFTIRPRSFLIALLTALLLPGVCAGAWDGEITEGADRLLVSNSTTPAGGESSWELEELWRLDGDDEDSEDFFGVLSHAVFDADGNVYLLDRQLHEVKVYSAAGEFLRVIGREGEGPGEFRRPAGLFFLPDARLAVLQSRPARIVLMATDGTPAGDILFPASENGGFRGVNGADCLDGRLALIESSFLRSETGGERSTSLALLDADSGESVRLDSRRFNFDFAKPVIRELDSHYLWRLLPGERVILSDDFDYRFTLFGSDGLPDRDVTMDYPDLMRDRTRRQERAEELAGTMRFGMRGNRRRAQPETVVEPREPGIVWLGVDGAGRIWVFSGREVLRENNGGLGRFEIFDAQGRLIHRVALSGEGDPTRDLFVMQGDRLLILREYYSAAAAMRGAESEESDESSEEALPMSVICYRLPDLDV